MSAVAEMFRIARELGIRTRHRATTEREARDLAADSGAADTRLVDLCHLPFVTIDYATSWDLDQALFIRRSGAGFEVYYALADAAHFVRLQGALFEEAMERGASYYLPGLVLPMLPTCLSEGVTSLLPFEDRRAVTFRIELDGDGAVVRSELLRARIRSRAKLTYSGVQHFLTDGDSSPCSGSDYAESLELLATVGRKRIALAAARDVVRYDRVSVGLSLSEDGDSLALSAETRNEVQRYNEQISLLCNTEGARLLRERLAGANDPRLPGIYRVHEPPSENRLDELEDYIAAAVQAHGADDGWLWRRRGGESLADYVARLPEGDGATRLARAIQRQAMVSSRPSYFSTEPGPHYGIGAGAYSRFSAPMREIVGIVTQYLALGTGTAKLGVELIDRTVDSGNRAKELQKRADKAAQRVALDQLFSRELSLTLARRTRWRGTVMGVTETKLYVQLDAPPIDLKLYAEDLEPEGGFAVDARGAAVSFGGHRWLVGGGIDLIVRERRDERWLLVPAP